MTPDHLDIDGRDHRTDFIYEACCKRRFATIEPTLENEPGQPRPGRLTISDPHGNTVYSAVVADTSLGLSEHLNEFGTCACGNDPNGFDLNEVITINETTTRYDGRHRPIGRTVWLQPISDPIFPKGPSANIPLVQRRADLPPVDGLTVAYENADGLVGLTTTWSYDDNLIDGQGFDADPSNADYLALLGLGGQAAGRAVSTTNPEGETTTTITDGVGRTVLVIDPEGNATQTIYDAVTGGLLATTLVRDPTAGTSGETLALTTSRASDGAGRTLISTDEEGNDTLFGYDANNNRISFRDPNGVGEDCRYDAANRKVACIDTAGDATLTFYDAASQVVQTIDGIGTAALGGPTTVVGSDPIAAHPVDPQAQYPDASTLGSDSCTYDGRGRKVLCEDRLNGQNPVAGGPQQSDIEYLYDDNNNLVAIVDNEDGVTTYAYDERNLLVTETFPGHVTGTTPGDADYDLRAYTYDGARRLINRLDQNGDTTGYAYDQANRLLERSYPDGLDDAFSYDDASRLLTAASQRYDNLVTRAYNDDSTLATEVLDIDDLNLEIAHGYDDANRMVACTYPEGQVATKEWTARSQLESCTFASEVVTSLIEYDLGRRMVGSTAGNGIETTYAYRADNLVDEIYDTGRAIVDFGYSYDANKRKTAETDGVLPAYSQSFAAYDNEDRLIDWSRSGSGGTLPQAQDWQLSLVGDWQETDRDGVVDTRDHNDVHEIETRQIGTDPVQDLEHDAKGNLTRNPDRQHTYGWDFDNRMARTVSDVSESSGQVVVEAEDYVEQVAGSGAYASSIWTETSDTAYAGWSGRGYMEVVPNNDLSTGDTTDGPRLDYAVHFSTPGTYRVWAHLWGASNADDSVHVGLEGNLLTAGKYGMTDNGNQWAWVDDVQGRPGTDAVTMDIPSAGTYVINVWMREDGARLDKLVFTQDSGFSPSGTGPATDSAVVTYRYDALGRRVQKHATSGPATTYACAGAQVLSEYTDGVIAQSYVYGMYVDEPLALIDHTNSDAMYFYHRNHLYSVAAITDASGAVARRYAYGAYGQQEVVADAAGDGLEQPYGFTGRRLDDESGLWYFRARYYDDELGHFVGRDDRTTSQSAGVWVPAAMAGLQDGLSLYRSWFIPHRADPSGFVSPIGDDLGGPDSGFYAERDKICRTYVYFGHSSNFKIQAPEIPGWIPPDWGGSTSDLGQCVWDRIGAVTCHPDLSNDWLNDWVTVPGWDGEENPVMDYLDEDGFTLSYKQSIKALMAAVRDAPDKGCDQSCCEGYEVIVLCGPGVYEALSEEYDEGVARNFVQNNCNRTKRKGKCP